MDKIEQQIEKLAIAVANGFDAVDKRFDEQQAYMDERFDAIDRRFEGVDQRLGNVEQQLRDIRSDVRELKEIAISLDEQTELRARLVRIEDHLGLSHELSKVPAA